MIVISLKRLRELGIKLNIEDPEIARAELLKECYLY